jgi:gliding motility-associated-like protein
MHYTPMLYFHIFSVNPGRSFKIPIVRYHKAFLLTLLFILSAGKLFATHFYGVDLFYTHMSGNTYKVSMVAFGDCSGAQFPTFSSLRPGIHIMKGNTEFISDFLDQEPPKAGIEVTPVCPDELGNTTCVNPSGTVPGVKKFVYSKEFTLSGPAPDWRFVFLGETDGTTIAGRSNSLTNVNPVGTINLEATLNNTQQDNSSPEYTTIATPFYCENKPVNFNPGAVDADGDSLVYELVPGMDQGVVLTYVSGYSGSNPINAVAGTFGFSSSTGQLMFTPASIQKSLVVYRVSEYRKGQLLGTSMREMTVVIMPCDNNPPAGEVSNASGSTIVDSVSVQTCIGNHELSFDINPVDADGNKIFMVVNGLPKGATLDITDNNTTNPQGHFVWNMPVLPDGEYTFFVTCTDDGCPIASKQTRAYTIRIGPENIYANPFAAGCTTQGFLEIMSPSGWLPWSCKIYRDGAVVNKNAGIYSYSWGDSIAPGKYKAQAVNYLGCTAELVVDVPLDCEVADIPNAFSPNGDGKNDVLYVRGSNMQTMSFKVYNRWGQIVFETHDPSKGWDGKYKASEAPVEAYAYVLSVVFKSGGVFQKQGNITLLR